jgi:hypothetical protein
VRPVWSEDSSLPHPRRSVEHLEPPCSRSETRTRSERLVLRETLNLDLALIGALAFPEGVGGPADRTEHGLMLTRHGRRIDRAILTRSMARTVVAEPLSHGGRETLLIRTQIVVPASCPSRASH